MSHNGTFLDNTLCRRCANGGLQMICFGNKSDLTDIRKGVCRLSQLVNKSCPATGWHDTEPEVGSRGYGGGHVPPNILVVCHLLHH